MADYSSEDIRRYPVSITAEQSVLGSILIDPDSLTQIADMLSPDDFSVSVNKEMYRVMRGLFDSSHNIDVTILVDELIKANVFAKDELDRCKEYLRSLSTIVPSSLNIKDYARIVKDKSLLRDLILASEDISATAMKEAEPVSNILDYAESKIFNLAQGRDTKNFRTFDEILKVVFADLKELSQNPESKQGLATGFSTLDKVLAGLGNTDLVLIGARPGMGKTSFALNIATNVAKANRDKAVAIFSLEMSAEQLVERVLSSEALVDSYALRTGKLTQEDWANLAHAIDELYGLKNILIDDTSGQTVTGIRAKLRRVRQPLGMVVIDYLQLMQGETHSDNRVQEVADISRGLKLLAKEMRCPVLCCAQLSRGPEGRTDKRPMLSDLRDSGAIEQDADMVMFLYRPEYYPSANDKSQNDSNIAEVIVAKNRHGATDKVPLGWIARFTKFRSLAENELEGLNPPPAR